MYVTRPLSLYLREREALSLPPPDGPNSGVLVIQDVEAEQPAGSFGLLKSNQVKGLPFPQNKNLRVHYTQHAGQYTQVYTNRVLFIPVLNQPLSSNLYYVIQRDGKHIGEAHISSTEGDMKTCCFCRCIATLKPQPLDPQSAYQQFEIQQQKWGGFSAKSVSSDGFPPDLLRREGWLVYASTPRGFQLSEAAGLNRALRTRLPDFNFVLSEQTPNPVVVGKWYCPFMFLKEGTVEDQMKSSTYYEMTLEQQWVQIFRSENNHKEGTAATVDTVVENEVLNVAGRKVTHDEREVVDGVMWFRNSNNVGGKVDVGLSLAIIDKIMWEEEMFGWSGGGGGGGSAREVRVKRMEEFAGIGGWRKFGCYVLAERFALKIMDGSLVLTYEFRHTHQIRTKWE